ncbi:DUF3618 domain-containing protein [Saccharomonospora viridis]|jgi:hypothetical protein|uniref:DUF3618 domain-containing protein n=2 Tax=Saccharomonospora viridis TaxID=1852 RepID=C7MZS6_SACVD|nr:DUF3618 domain-containing protein [Saccharomonospora viridis]ACU96194.1 hypothetical protein Svir_11380 [Saccharomonospora viridis DSM 43017]KHF45300.1 hypothetical protein MINT15_05170 [Saccharomonospora viridis]SFP79767.1 Protein of unknown function [Saccharomonospora viridis]
MSTSDDDFPQTMDQVRTDIELTRQELGETARELFYRLNVGERAKERFQDRSQTVLRVLRANPVAVAIGGGVLTVLLGGLLTWKLK